MDKFEKCLIKQIWVLPKILLYTMSYASFNDFNKMEEQYHNEAINLRSQVQILEGKLQFYEREFQIKQASFQKRIQQLISTSSQITQQNTQFKLQYSTLLNEYQLLYEKLNQYEKGQKEYEEKVRSLIDGLNKFQIEKEQLIQLANICRERSKLRKAKVKELTAILFLDIYLSYSQYNSNYLTYSCNSYRFMINFNSHCITFRIK